MDILRKIWDVEVNRYIILGVLLLIGYLGYYKLNPTVRINMKILYKNGSDQTDGSGGGDWLYGAIVTLYDKDKNVLAEGKIPKSGWGRRLHFPHFKLGDCLAMKQELKQRRIYNEKLDSFFDHLSENELIFKHHHCKNASKYWVGSWVHKVALIKIDHPSCQTTAIPFRGEGKWSGLYDNALRPTALTIEDDDITHWAYRSFHRRISMIHSFRHILTSEMCSNSY